MNLLLLKPEDIQSNGYALVEGRRAEHIHCVLHSCIGDKIRCGILGGKLGFAELQESSRRHALLKLHAKFDTPPPLARQLRFIIALPRPQSFKKTLHFIASAGIKEVWFIASERVEKSYWKSSALEPENITNETMLALEQGMDTVPPRIEFRDSFREFVLGGELAEISKDSRNLIAHPVNAVECPRALTQMATIAIGPEGGFIAREVELFIATGFEPVTLGAHILRVEFATAYIAGRIS